MGQQASPQLVMTAFGISMLRRPMVTGSPTKKQIGALDFPIGIWYNLKKLHRCFHGRPFLKDG